MTDVPDTADELLDAWNGVGAPAEPSPTIHPATRREPRTLHVVGSAWRAHEQPGGWWLFTHARRPIWRAKGSVADVWCVLAAVRDQDPPRAESLGHAGDVERSSRQVVPSPAFHRGLRNALLIVAPIWGAVAYGIARWRRWL